MSAMRNCMLCRKHKFCPEWKAKQVDIRNEMGYYETMQICQFSFKDQTRYGAGELNAGLCIAKLCSRFQSTVWKK